MNVNDIFPKMYSVGLDLHGQAVTVTIAGISKERMHPPGDGPLEKYVLFFKETPRAVLLTPNLAKQIVRATGRDDTDEWIGQRITLYPEEIKVFGMVRIAIRAKAAAESETA